MNAAQTISAMQSPDAHKRLPDTARVQDVNEEEEEWEDYWAFFKDEQEEMKKKETDLVLEIESDDKIY